MRPRRDERRSIVWYFLEIERISSDGVACLENGAGNGAGGLKTR
jgi:hypothetical protein